MLEANYFDGQSTRIRTVHLSVAGDELIVAGSDIDLRVPFAAVRVDERLGRAPRRLHLNDGSFCEVRDLHGLDALLSQTAHRDGRVDRMQRQFRIVLPACIACLALGVAAYRWGLPWAAAWGAQHLPPAVGKTLSVQTLQILDGRILMPSKIAEARRQALSAQFHALRLPDGGAVDSVLLFRGSPELGANAFTLPDGTIIVLDDLITAIGDDRQILAVLAHELGHAHGHHGLQLLIQSSAAGAFLAFYLGDVSHLLAAAPTALVQARYSREFERRADDYAAMLLLHNGLSPALLADALETLMKSHPGSSAGYLSSHPSTDERMRRLRQPGALPVVSSQPLDPGTVPAR
jgi:Zn-dependent protease with chaperone function